jgi:hypothetical protein
MSGSKALRFHSKQIEQIRFLNLRGQESEGLSESDLESGALSIGAKREFLQLRSQTSQLLELLILSPVAALPLEVRR